MSVAHIDSDCYIDFIDYETSEKVPWAHCISCDRLLACERLDVQSGNHLNSDREYHPAQCFGCYVNFGPEMLPEWKPPPLFDVSGYCPCKNPDLGRSPTGQVINWHCRSCDLPNLPF